MTAASRTQVQAGESVWALTARRFLKHRLAVFSACVLAVLALAALSAPLAEAVLGADAESVDLFNRFQPPSLAHPLGTDTGSGSHCLFRLGVHLGELWYLSELSAELRKQSRSRFLLTAPPLRLPGAVGSPVTPVGTI